MKKILFLYLFSLFLPRVFGEVPVRICFYHDEANQKIDVWYDEQLFTSYSYSDRYRKVAFYPIITPEGNYITRGFPYSSRPSELADHPHQIGLTFVFGSVNGVDFWNNSYARSTENAYKYGTIRHKEIVKMRDGGGVGTLIVRSEWVDYQDNVLLEEVVEYRFGAYGNIRYIERNGQMTAIGGDVEFKDNKEGLWVIRLAREFEEPQGKPELRTDSRGYVMKEPVVMETSVSGVMRNDRGDEKEEGTFGKPTRWLANTTMINGERITAILMDNAANIGYPARAFSRGYGMMALNNLGTRCYIPDSEPFYFKLTAGQSVQFLHKFMLVSGQELSSEELESEFDSFEAPVVRIAGE